MCMFFFWGGGGGGGQWIQQPSPFLFFRLISLSLIGFLLCLSFFFFYFSISSRPPPPPSLPLFNTSCTQHRSVCPADTRSSQCVTRKIITKLFNLIPLAPCSVSYVNVFHNITGNGVRRIEGFRYEEDSWLQFSRNVTLTLANQKFTNILAAVQKASWWEILEAILAVCGPLI